MKKTYKEWYEICENTILRLNRKTKNTYLLCTIHNNGFLITKNKLLSFDEFCEVLKKTGIGFWSEKIKRSLKYKKII